MFGAAHDQFRRGTALAIDPDPYSGSVEQHRPVAAAVARRQHRAAHRVDVGVDRGDLALVEQRDAVVQRAVLDEHRADQHRRAAIAGRLRHRLELGGGAFDQRRLENQVLGRVADQLQLGKDDQVGPLRLGPRGEHRRRVAGDVTDRLVELGESDLQRIGHAPR